MFVVCMDLRTQNEYFPLPGPANIC